MANNFARRSSYDSGRGNGGLFGQYSGYLRSYGYQGYIAYQDPPTGVVPLSQEQIGQYNSSPNNATAFTYYNEVNKAPKFNQTSSISVSPSPDVAEDPSWYIDSGASCHITSDSSKLLNLNLMLDLKCYLLEMEIGYIFIIFILFFLLD